MGMKFPKDFSSELWARPKSGVFLPVDEPVAHRITPDILEVSRQETSRRDHVTVHQTETLSPRVRIQTHVRNGAK